MRKLERNQELIDFITLDPHKLTTSLIKSLTTQTLQGGKITPPKYHLDDYFTLKPGECCKNTKEVITSIGILIMNKWFIEPYLQDFLKYQNQRFDSGMFKKLDKLVASLYSKDKIEFEVYEYHLNASQQQGQLAEIFSPSYSEGTLSLPPGAAKLKKDLLEKHKSEIEAGDVVIANMIKAKIIDKVKEELKDDPALENYTSGSKASFGDTYALMNIMQGPVKKVDGSGYKVVTNSYDEGISKEDYVSIANSAVQGTKSRALDVAVGGTEQRKILAMAQGEVYAGPGTDCKTKETITITLRNYEHSIYVGRFIDVNGTKVHLTEDTIKKYIGKKINLYSPGTCKMPSPTYCEKCCGTHPNEFGAKKIGLFSQGAGSAMLNSNLKAFHVQSVAANKINPSSLLIDDDDD